MVTKQRLGEILVQEGLVAQDDVEQALRTQIGGNRRLGHILIRMKLISADHLAETLASQLGVEICDIPQRYSSKVSRKLPRYLCRRFGVIPLAQKENNVLELAMSDPCDEDAIRDIEQYTGMVVQPLLAKQSDIDKEIPVRVPLGIKDFFSPQFNIALTRVGVCVCIVMLVLLAGFTYQYINQTKYGVEQVVDGTKVYKHHDLILEVDNGGALKFSGRSAFAKGYYSVSFKDKQDLKKFLDLRQADFSDQQTGWLGWAVSKRLP